MNKQEIKQQIQKLVDKYQRVAKAGKIKSYNEAQTRNEFIEPLFEFLGWDMRNLINDNEVTTEENVSGGRVDLAFRFNNIPAMFLEAKAMKVDLDEWKWAEQAINYSWNKSVTWAVLTDFESIKIFNAEIPPKSISQNLFIEIHCRDFINRFDQLWLLSKESFEQKLLDKEAQKWGKLVQRKQVGKKLFEDLSLWRVSLAKDFKKQNILTNEELDEGVQRILDRLIFIRTAEDRKIEPNVLLGILRGGKSNSYKQLIKVFHDFDDGFNSKLFAPHYSEEWKASDKVIDGIIKGLYETKDGYRYDFSVISADVLGGIYEQYLSYVQGHKSEEKQKSKRKSQGIYYTPKYIVDFIIKETLGEILKKIKPKDISKIKVLDPACGSGSFLTAAYDAILDKIKNPSLFSKFEILKDNIFGVDLDGQAIEIARLNLLLKVLSQKTKLPTLQHNINSGNSLISGKAEKLEEYFGENWRDQKPFNFEEEFKTIFETKSSKFHLLTFETKYSRRKSKSKNIEGVILSKEEMILVAECIAKSVKELGVKLLAASILPDHVHLVIADMGREIADIVKQIKGFSARMVNRRFKSSVQGEGYQQSLWSKSYNDSFLDDEKHLFAAIEYVKNNHLKHKERWGKIDNVKIQKALTPALRDVSKFQWSDFEYSEGGFDVIIGNPPWGASLSQAEKYFFKDNYKFSGKGIVDTFALFIEKAGRLLKDGGYLCFVLPDILLLKNYPGIRQYILDNFTITKINYHGMAFKDVNLNAVTIVLKKIRAKSSHNINITINKGGNKVAKNRVSQFMFNSLEGYKFNIHLTPELSLMKERLEKNFTLLAELSEVHEGIHSGNVREKLFINHRLNDNCFKLIFGRDEMNRYFLKWNGKWVNYDKKVIDKKRGEYAGLGKKDYFIQPKILIRRTGDRILAVTDNNGFFASNNMFVLFLKKEYKNEVELDYLTALLNSRFMTFFFNLIQPREKQLFAELKINHLKQFPIPKTSKQSQREIVDFVSHMSNLQKELHRTSAKTDKHNSLKREIEKLDSEINEAIYKLYGLTSEEIKIIKKEEYDTNI